MTQAGADVALNCRLEGNRPGPQFTGCSADYVAVFADANIAVRPLVQTDCSLTGAPVQLIPVATTLNLNSPYGGASPCALTGFSFRTEMNDSFMFNGLFMKTSAIGAGTSDCENAFGASAKVQALVNGREVLDLPTLPANQDPRAWCYGAYYCPDPKQLEWGGDYVLDSAVLR